MRITSTTEKHEWDNMSKHQNPCIHRNGNLNDNEEDSTITTACQADTVHVEKENSPKAGPGITLPES